MLVEFLLPILFMSIMAYVSINILFQASGIFSFLPQYYVFAFGNETGYLKPIPAKLKLVLFECAKCNSGWWAIAYYFDHWNFSFWPFVTFVLITIFTTYLLEKTIIRIYGAI